MTHGVHKGLTKMQIDRNEADRKHLLRKISAEAAERMTRMPAKQQLEQAQKELEEVPDADDSSVGYVP